MFSFEGAFDEDFEFFEVDRFGEEVEGAAFHGLDSGFDVAVGGEHDGGWAVGEGDSFIDDG